MRESPILSRHSGGVVEIFGMCIFFRKRNKKQRQCYKYAHLASIRITYSVQNLNKRYY